VVVFLLVLAATSLGASLSKASENTVSKTPASPPLETQDLAVMRAAMLLSPETASVAQLVAHPDTYRPSLLEVSGDVASVSQDQSETIVGLSDGGTVLAVRYPGSRTDLRQREGITVAGVLRPENTGFAAVAIGHGRLQSSQSAGWLMRSLASPLTWLIAAALFLIASIAYVLLRRGNVTRAVKVVTMTLALVMVILASGCSVVLQTTVHPDGSGTTTTSLVADQQTIQQALSVPNARAFLGDWARNREAQGSKVQATQGGLSITRTFATPQDFASGDTSDSATWLRLSRLTLPDGVHSAFLGVLDASSQLGGASEIGSDQSSVESEQLSQQLQQTDLDYSLHLPGTVVSGGSGGHLAWKVPADSSTRVFGESVLSDGGGALEGSSNGNPSDALTWWVARIMAAAAAALLVYGSIAYTGRQAQSGGSAT